MILNRYALALCLALTSLYSSVATSANIDVPFDKQLHFGVSAAIGFASYSVLDKNEAFLACSSVGLMKELYDEYDYGGFDKNDMVMNLIGCGIGYAVGDKIGFKINLDRVGDVNILSFNYSF